MENEHTDSRFLEYFPFTKSNLQRTTPFAPQDLPLTIKSEVSTSNEQKDKSNFVVWFKKYEEWVMSERTKDWLDKEKIITALNIFIPSLYSFNFSNEVEKFCKWVDVPFPLMRLYTTSWGNKTFFGHWYSTNNEAKDEIYNKCLPLYTILEVEYMNIHISTHTPSKLYRGSSLPDEVLDTIRNLKTAHVFLRNFTPAIAPMYSTSQSLEKTCHFIKNAYRRECARKVLWKFTIVPMSENKKAMLRNKFPNIRLIPALIDIQNYSAYGHEKEWLLFNGPVFIDKIRENVSDEEVIVIEALLLDTTIRFIENEKSMADMHFKIIKWIELGQFTPNNEFKEASALLSKDKQKAHAISEILFYSQGRSITYQSFSGLDSMGSYDSISLENLLMCSAMVKSVCCDSYQQGLENYTAFLETCECPIFAFKRLNRWFRPAFKILPSSLSNMVDIYDLNNAAYTDFCTITKDLLILYRLVGDKGRTEAIEQYQRILSPTSPNQDSLNFLKSCFDQAEIGFENRQLYIEPCECVFVNQLKMLWKLDAQKESEEFVFAEMRLLVISGIIKSGPLWEKYINSVKFDISFSESSLNDITPLLNYQQGLTVGNINTQNKSEPLSHRTIHILNALQDMGVKHGALDDLHNVPQDKLYYWLNKISQLNQ